MTIKVIAKVTPGLLRLSHGHCACSEMEEEEKIGSTSGFRNFRFHVLLSSPPDKQQRDFQGFPGGSDG